MRIRPARRLRGRVARLPGDKSVSHRAAILAALARGGRSRLSNFATSADCASTLRCLRQLGVSVERDGADVFVGGANVFGLLDAPADALDCGNSGSTMRMLAGLLAGQPFASVLTGDDSLRSRPMRRVVEPLELMGARLGTDERGRAPLRIEGRRPLAALRYAMPVASAQVKSAVLLAGLFAEGRTEVVERGVVTRDHTERMLRWFGVPVEAHDGGYETDGAAGETAHVVSVEGGAEFGARDVEVPGDVSSAAFLVAAAALLPGSELEIGGVGLNPTRTEFLTTMRRLGARVERRDVRERSNEPGGDLYVSADGPGLAPRADGREEPPSPDEAGSPTSPPNVLRGAAVARLIDELPVLAVVGTQVEGGLVIREAAELRVKESDRISATVENLRAMGAEVEEYEDGFAVGGPARLRGARLDGRGDHRIAMAFTVAALAAEGESEIVGAECVAVSFPEFFTLLESVTER
ncbi:MAG TPA: 3-phosphoshikimate 1-carboxyvinyltransferase [Pyrinomonadaceae bacterium]|nr:3-phosphoshikimate 1-carboxyvinyltransferase [Pyrinomonadaceae bacterium]